MCVVCACVCVYSRQGRELGVASTAPAVVWMAVYLFGYSDYLTGFHEPLSPPHRCHTGLKKMSSTITAICTLNLKTNTRVAACFVTTAMPARFCVRGGYKSCRQCVEHVP